MERLAPNERKRPEISPQAWGLVVEHGPYIHERARWYYGQLMGRPVFYKGEAFQGAWEVKGYFRGRQAQDFIEETFAGVLESVGTAMERYDKAKAQPNTYIDRVVRYTLNRELAYWEKSSSRQPEGKGGEVDLFLVTGDPDDDWIEGANAIDQDNDERLAVNPFDEDEFGVEAADALLASLRIQDALTERELYVLRRRAEGSSWGAIAEDLGIESRGAVQNMFTRAQTKARAALENVDD